MNHKSSIMRSRSIGLSGHLVLLVALAACTDVVLVTPGIQFPPGGTSSPTAALASISVSLSTNSAQVGQSAKATVSGTDQYGKQFAPGIVTWSTTPDGLATVNSEGLVTAIAEGVATVWAFKAGVPPGSASIVISR